MAARICSSAFSSAFFFASRYSFFSQGCDLYFPKNLFRRPEVKTERHQSSKKHKAPGKGYQEKSKIWNITSARSRNCSFLARKAVIVATRSKAFSI